MQLLLDKADEGIPRKHGVDTENEKAVYLLREEQEVISIYYNLDRLKGEGLCKDKAIERGTVVEQTHISRQEVDSVRWYAPFSCQLSPLSLKLVRLRGEIL